MERPTMKVTTSPEIQHNISSVSSLRLTKTYELRLSRGLKDERTGEGGALRGVCEVGELP